MWNKSATTGMRTAIEQSNMLSFTNGPLATIGFIPEFEAAALATIPRLAAKHKLKVRTCAFADPRGPPSPLPTTAKANELGTTVRGHDHDCRLWWGYSGQRFPPGHRSFRGSH